MKPAVGPSMKQPGRRRLLVWGARAGAGALAGAAARASRGTSNDVERGARDTESPAPVPAPGRGPQFDPALPDRPLRFPRDFGMHPGFRTEWWYVTGWLEAAGRAFGFQLTFFRSRTGHDPRNPSRFAPTQLLLAHAAIAEEGAAKLRHDQRAARAGFGLASASESDTDVAIGAIGAIGAGWRLRRSADDRYHARIDADGFALDLTLTPPGPPVPQGREGFSRKGPLPSQASHYYSRPKLAVSGRLDLSPATARGERGLPPTATDQRGVTATGRGEPGLSVTARGERGVAATGSAWLDHEWSSELLDPRATGWDWVGLDLDDGTALMAFRIRSRDGGVLWSDANWIGARIPTATPRFTPIRTWRSPRSAAEWPVAMRLEVAGRTLELQPLFDDQELDTRASTGTIYWEGAVRVFERGRQVGRGYLELTGYAGQLRL